MKTITVTKKYNLFKYEELSEKAKENVKVDDEEIIEMNEDYLENGLIFLE